MLLTWPPPRRTASAPRTTSLDTTVSHTQPTHALVVFKAPSHGGFARGAGRAVGRVAAVAGDLFCDDFGRFSVVGAGQVVLAPQAAGAVAEEGAAWRSEDLASAEAEAASADFGLLPLALLEGKAVAVAWPPAAARWLQ